MALYGIKNNAGDLIARPGDIAKIAAGHSLEPFDVARDACNFLNKYLDHTEYHLFEEGLPHEPS